jgi:DNA-binding MarR family transcriptional regulator
MWLSLAPGKYPDAVDLPAEERIGLHLKRVEQELMAVKHAALRPYGLTVPQYAALYFLAANPGMPAAALARACLVTPQTMATVLANLEAKELIVRSPHPWHRNAQEVRTTDAGQRILEQADAQAVAIERTIADEFSPQEREQLIGLLARVSQRLAELGAQPAGHDSSRNR